MNVEELKVAIIGIIVASVIAFIEGIVIINHIDAKSKVNVVQVPVNKT